MPKNILVCLDDTTNSQRILPYAVEQALSFGGTLIILYACTPVPINTNGVSGMSFIVINPEINDTGSNHGLPSYITEKEQALAAKGVKVEGVTVTGSFTDSTLRFISSHSVDLIAMTAHP
jgi:hypothetical protein